VPQRRPHALGERFQVLQHDVTRERPRRSP
jgi:hypothetical protein